MAGTKQTAKDQVGSSGDSSSPPRCGVVMPISATQHHSADHWANVQTLLHRAIRTANFEPENVWEGDLNDRISKRIVASLFSHQIVVVDASDVNPNVMLELGLRLASKKPTIVVTDNIGDLPFDIRDLEALTYPSDLNILGMEKFFDDLKRMLTAKYEASKLGTYQSYLSDVVVEVVEPETREVTFDSAMLDRLDEINRRIARIESGSRNREARSAQTEFSSGSRFVFTVPNAASTHMMDYLRSKGQLYSFVSDQDKHYFLVENFSGSPKFINDLTGAIAIYDGVPGVPEDVLRRLGHPGA